MMTAMVFAGVLCVWAAAKMCNKGKKRVRDADRWPTNAERRARAAELRANLAPRGLSRRACKHGVDDPLHGVVSAWNCDAAAESAVVELQRVVDCQPGDKWLQEPRSSDVGFSVVRQQLRCTSKTSASPELVVAASHALDRVCASAPCCPKCGQPISAHVRSKWDVAVNRYRVGSGFVVHRDVFKGMCVYPHSYTPHLGQYIPFGGLVQFTSTRYCFMDYIHSV